jgi:NSS family neurotransmitter:Na+ symporter
MKKEKHGFSSRIGFILAAAGSAVGLGNIWRFPYLAARHGGGIFLLVYLILAVTFGFSLLVTEIALGRKTGKSSVKAFSALNRKWGFTGYLEAAVPIIIFPYYCVIGGWVTKYLTVYAANDAHLAASDEYFSGFISKTGQPIIFLLIFIGLTSAVVFMGVQKGIEKISKILMPILILISIGIAVYALTLDGATDGLLFYIKPDFSKFSIKTVIAAMGQLFYSMSLAMGIMITYGSYMRKEDNLEKSVRHIEIFDTAIAFISGLMIIPAVFIFSHGDESKLNAGPSLMFETLPKVFDSMYGGKIIGFVFFVLVLFAALTSAISLMETIVSIFSDKLKCSRRVICFWVMIVSSIMAIPSSLGYGMWSGVKLFGFAILDFFDFLSNNILMPIVALLTCIFVGYVIKTKTIEDEVELSGEFKSKKLYRIMIKYVAPIFVITILISSVFGIV